MNLTNIMGSVSQIAPGGAPLTNQFTTTPFQCDDAAPKDHWVKAVFCGPCVAAKAKSTADRSHVCFNCLCYSPLGAYNSIRLTYGIIGECSKDMLYGCLCVPCGARQVYTESEQLGAGPTTVQYGSDTGTWTVPLLACDPSTCCKAFWCPCVVAHDIRTLLLPSSKDSKWFNYFCIYPTSMYGQTRHVAGIKSEWPHPVLEDICVGTLFYPCGLVRANTEAIAWRAKQAGASAIAGGMNAAKKKADQVTGAAKEKFGNFMK